MTSWGGRGVVRADLDDDAASSEAPSLVSPEIHSILYYASLAPSGHNAQPWSVRLGNGEIWLGTDPKRWLPSVDPTNREMLLSLGAFLENLIAAAPAHGYAVDHHDVCSTSDESVLIRVALKPTARRSFPLERLRGRRTLRTGHLGRELTAPDVATLSAAAGAEQAFFFTTASKEGRALAESTLEANRLQIARDDAQEELAEWIRWTAADGRAHRNGFTPESLEITGLAGWYVRHFMDRDAVLGKSFRARSLKRVRQQLSRYGGWLVITSEGGSIPAVIDAGQRCERTWLMARECSIAVHPMSQALEEAPFKNQITQALGLPGQVQFILRLSYVTTYPDPVSLRMPVSWFLRSGLA